MKRMLIAIMVLAVASLANAGIVIVAPDNVSGSIQTDPIDVEVVQQALFLATAGSGEVSNMTLVYPGPLSRIPDPFPIDPGLIAAIDYCIGEYAAAHSGFAGGPSTGVYLIELFDGTAPPGTPVPVVGQLVTFDVAGRIEAYLIDPELAECVFSAVVIPEPITFALLGLGGLFLRRRK